MKYGFELIKKFSGMREISKRTHHLAKYLYENLAALKYQNGSKVVEIYASNDYCDPNTQGGIVNFNILHKDGKIFGFTEFRKIAIHCNLVVRVGCFCNIGSCQKYLGITDEDIELNHKVIYNRHSQLPSGILEKFREFCYQLLFWQNPGWKSWRIPNKVPSVPSISFLLHFIFTIFLPFRSELNSTRIPMPLGFLSNKNSVRI